MRKTLTAIIALAAFVCLGTTNTVPKAAPPATSTNAPSVFTRGYDNFTGLFKQQTATEFYSGGKLDFDISATYTAAGGTDFGNLWTSNFKHGLWGLNIGSTFWISKYFGTGLDFGITDINNPGGWLFNYGGIDLLARYPIGRFCPYIIGTGGRNFDASTYYYGVGPGVSFALTDRAKLFTDARFLWQGGNHQTSANGSETSLLTRFGLTISF